jgi:hypothetical protein
LSIWRKRARHQARGIEGHFGNGAKRAAFRCQSIIVMIGSCDSRLPNPLSRKPIFEEALQREYDKLV